MHQEANRLNTFSNWPSSAPVDSVRIAKAGFFYTGQGMEVQCFSCGGKISEWDYGDQVMWRHRRLAPNCTFVVNPQLSGNIPHVVGRDCPSVLNSSPSLPLSETEPQDAIDSTEDYGVTEEDEMYQNDALRLLTYTNWVDTSASPQALASSGFYHAGQGRLRCAWCGGELAPFRSFGTLGPPLEVHRMYFPRCRHAASLEARRRSVGLSPPSSPPSYTPPIQSPPTSDNDSQPQSEGAAHNEALLAGNGTWRSLGLVGSGARHAMYAGLASRLTTFNRWPADRTQQPQALAEAGFFYTGTDDQVRCFYCDGGLGKWEAGDAPWSEHAHWFPHCGYVLLVKGQDFVDTCRNRSSVQRTFSADSGLSSRRRNPGVNFSITESQVEECMESSVALAALGAGLDAARVRRALARRLRATGLPFNSSEALIDAVLDEQLNEEAWSVNPQSQRLARDILAETLRDFAPRSGIIPASHWEERSESQRSNTPSPTRSDTPTQSNSNTEQADPNATNNSPSRSNINSPSNSTQSRSRLISRINSNSTGSNLSSGRTSLSPHRTNPSRTDLSPNRIGQAPSPTTSDSNATNNNEENKEESESPLKVGKKELTLEEENRQLKEARLCKVCMDNEVSVVFLPCGHLVSCARCGAALSACPLCRCSVRALVRAYLA